MEAIKVYFRHLLGYYYLLNKKTGEVHYLPNVKFQCGISKMEEKNRQYLTKAQFDKMKFKYISRKYINGCRFCNKQNDKG